MFVYKTISLSIPDGSGRFKFNAYSGDLFAKSPRGQIESHSVQIESQRVSNRELNLIATLISPIAEQLTIARALAVQLPV